MSNKKSKKKKAIKKKIILASSFILSTGVIASISLSQISFATNSLDNNIKLLSENNKDKEEQLNANNTSQRAPALNNENVGKIVDGCSPFWKSAKLTKDNYWKTDKNYQYFAANTDPTKTNNYWTNPGIAFAWYGNDHSYLDNERPFPGHAAAGPGQITFYTRVIEDCYYDKSNFYYDAQDNTYKNLTEMILLWNQNFINAYKHVFFDDINSIQPNQFVDFVNSIISKDTGYGTNNKNQKPFEASKDGSILAQLIFNHRSGLPGRTSGPNINLGKIVFYPTSYVFDSNNFNNSSLTCDVPVKAPYNTVWIGNENGQQASSRNYNNEKVNPTVDYNSVKNASLMRAMTLDSLTLRTWQDDGSKTYQYQSTGAIKFRIFYEYDFIRSKNNDFTYDIDYFKNNQGVNLEDYLIYDEMNANQETWKVDASKLKNLIINNYKSILKNISYANNNNDGRNTNNGSTISGEMLIPEFEKLDTNKVIIEPGSTFTIDANNPNESSITFNVKIDINPVLNRQITIKFHNRATTSVIGDTIKINSSDVTPNIKQEDVINIIQNNINQIFNNITFADGTNAKVVKIEGFDNITGAKEGIIYFDSITLVPVYEYGNKIEEPKTFTTNISADNKFKIVGYQPSNDLSTVVQPTFGLIDDDKTKWTSILAQTFNMFVNENKVDDPKWVDNINAFKQLLINNNLIVNPIWATEKITIADFDFTIASFDNRIGSITLVINLLKYYEDGKLVTNKPKQANITINGFKILNETKVKSSDQLIFVDPNTSFKAASMVTNEEIDSFIALKAASDFLIDPINFAKNSIEEANNPWVQNTVIRRNPDKAPVANDQEGTLQVFAQASWYQSNNGSIVSEFTLDFEFTLTQYEKNVESLTTVIKNGDLKNVNTISPDSVTVDDKNIKIEIINSGLIQNLYPQAQALTPDDIVLSNLQPIGKGLDNKQTTGGVLICTVTINNSKAWTNGIVDSTKTFENVEFGGFKQQNPTDVQQSIDLANLGLSSLDLHDIQTDFVWSIEPSLQANLSKVILNQYAGSKVSFEYIPTSIDLINGTIDVNVQISNGIYDDKGNSSPNGSLGFPLNSTQEPKKTIKITGFIKQDNNTSTYLNNKMTLIGWENKVASIEMNNIELIDAIKKLVVDPNNIKNPNPAHEVTTNDVIEVIINSYDNLKGQLTITVTLNKDACLFNGQVLKQNLSIPNITIAGFKQLKQTTINNDSYVDGFSDIVASDITNNQVVIDAFKTAVANSSKQIFNNLVFDEPMSASNVQFVIKSYNNLKGTALFDITITGGYACDKDGELMDITFSNIDLWGFKQLETINVDGLILSMGKTTPTEFMKDEQKALYLIKQALLNSLNNNMFVYGYPTFNDIMVTINSVDDDNGLIVARIEIWNNNYVPPKILKTIPAPNNSTISHYVTNVNGEFIKWDPNNPNPFVLDNLVIKGFKSNDDWLTQNWLTVTLSSVGGGVGGVIVLYFVFRALRKFAITNLK